MTFWSFMAEHGLWLAVFFASLNLTVLFGYIGSAVARELHVIAQLLSMQVELSQQAPQSDYARQVAAQARVVAPRAGQAPQPRGGIASRLGALSQHFRSLQ